MLKIKSKHVFLRGPVPLSHLILRQYVCTGDTVVDATCGNGGDTLLLAELVGDSGQVWGFDIQKQALENTLQKLRGAGLEKRVALVNRGHENIAQHCTNGLAAVVFNLGYLPSGDRTVITTLETTLDACSQAQKLLKPGGVFAITLYPGHHGGDAEKAGVETWASRLSIREWHVWQMRQLNVSHSAPQFILIQKAY